MSTATGPAHPGPATDRTDARLPFGRLLHVELRKLVDTRSGRRLLAAVGVTTVGAVAVFLVAADPGSLTGGELVGVTTAPQSLLLPVLAILAATTEWTQRTALTTFTLEPRRGRVVLAKVAAVLAVALAAVAVALAAAAVATLLGAGTRGGPGTWDLTTGDVLALTVLQVLAVLQGLAFGMLLLDTAAAIVAWFVVPLLAGVLLGLVGALEGAAPWLDLGVATTPLSSGGTTTAGDWAHVAVAGALWVALPLLLGTARVLRREVR